MPELPLDGIRVLDSTYVFALPYTGGHLADLGAEVIKIEGPTRPDLTRNGGLFGSFPENEQGGDWWNRSSTYNLLNRGKESLVLDLSTERGRELFKELVSISDVVMENFTPRVMRGWNLDYPNLKKIKPDIILISNTGYGHGDGPYSSYPAQATTQEGTHGHCWVTGYAGEEPAKAGRSFVDFLSTWTGIFAIGAALRYRSLTGRGQWIDIAMYQAGAMFLSEYVMDAIANEREGERIGNRHPHRIPQGCYPAAGVDQWITLSVGSDEEWIGLCGLIGEPDLTRDPRFGDIIARFKNHDALDDLIRKWTNKFDKYELMHMLQDKGIPAGPVLTGQEVHFDEHYQSRNFLERVTYPDDRNMGTRLLMGRPYKYSNTPLKIRKPAPSFGAENEYLLKDILGLSVDDYDKLIEQATISSVPLSGDPAPRIDPRQSVEEGLLGHWDPDYRDHLGIS